MSKNDITGDSIRTRQTSQLYRDNWANVFGPKKKVGRMKENQGAQDSQVNTDTSRQCEDNR